MIDLSRIEWEKDGRAIKTDYYTCPTDETDNRLTRFLNGWQAYLKDPVSEGGNFEEKKQKLIWPTLGRLFASLLGDISPEKRRAIYAILLHEYVHSPRTKDWTEDERAKSLSYFQSNIA